MMQKQTLRLQKYITIMINFIQVLQKHLSITVFMLVGLFLPTIIVIL